MKKKTFVYQIEVSALPSEEKEDGLALELLEDMLDYAIYYIDSEINLIEDCPPNSIPEVKYLNHLKKMRDKYNKIKNSIKLIEVKE